MSDDTSQARSLFERAKTATREAMAELLKSVSDNVRKLYSDLRTDEFFSPENEATGSSVEHMSETGRYRLVTSSFRTVTGSWNYVQGKVYRVGTEEPIAVLRRNYSSFPFLFIEGHPNGHDYLVCGEDYQEQTVVELDTGKKTDSKAVGAPTGFCWVSYAFDARHQILTVDGCYWAAPFEFRFFDLSSPMSGWPELETEDWVSSDTKQPIVEEDGSIRCFETNSGWDDAEDDLVPDPGISVEKLFRREGTKLILVSETISDQERERRRKSKEAEEAYEKWVAYFRCNDPLYLAYLTGVAAMTAIGAEPVSYESSGVTYDKWAPDFDKRETRWCRRIATSKGTTIDLEWGVKIGPVKVVLYRCGKHLSDKFFEHSSSGMEEAFSYAKNEACR